MFCKSCQDNILNLDVSYDIHEDRSRSGRRVVHENLTALLCSASMGCELCSLLWALVYPEFKSPYPALPDYQTLLMKFLTEDRDQSHNSRPIWEGAEYPVEVNLGPDSKELSFHISKKLGLSATYTIQIAELETCVAYDDPLRDMFPRRPLSIDSSSNACFATASMWLTKCLKEHECPNTLSALPTRLIHVGNAETPPHLHVSHGEKGSWATLSHCWGTHQPLITTKNTLARHRESLELSTLPETFRDAVLITRKLGCSYLWIDSLCILQDSVKDWEAESKKMADIYQNALFNIAAEESSDDSAGIFKSVREKRKPMEYLALPCHSLKRGVEGVVLVKRSTSWPFVLDLTDKLPPASPLGNRGWVLQEKVLSARKLLYKSDNLYWECGTFQFPETFPTSTPRSPLRDCHSTHHISSSNNILGYNSKWWHMHVNDYTNRQLTFDKDRIPAIRGLVNAFAERTGYHYLNGIWLEDAVQGLAWRNSGHDIDFNQGPSWSWTSLVPKIAKRPIYNEDFVPSHLHRIYGPENQRALLVDPDIESLENGWRDGDGCASISLKAWCQDISEASHDSPLQHHLLQDNSNPSRVYANGGQTSLGFSLDPAAKKVFALNTKAPCSLNGQNLILLRLFDWVFFDGGEYRTDAMGTTVLILRPFRQINGNVVYRRLSLKDMFTQYVSFEKYKSLGNKYPWPSLDGWDQRVITLI